MKWLLCIPAIFCLATGMNGYAQKHTPTAPEERFTPRENVVFSDDFSEDKVGSFPSRWDTAACGYNYGYKWKVGQEARKNLLLMNTCFAHVMPKEQLARYLTDSFTLELDYFTANTFAELAVALMPVPHEKSIDRFFFCHKYSFYISQWGEAGTCMGSGKYADTGSAYQHTCKNTFHAKIDTAVWHHLGVSYKKRAVKIFLDDVQILTIPDCGYTPRQILLGGMSGIKYKNIKIATGPYATPLSALLKGRPITTHTILFATGTAALNAVSDSYLEELAQLLKAHSALKLDICGHTDNTGTEPDNQALSERRAAAVKNALIKKGVADQQLSTKGFGASKPLKAGSTEEIRAMNRRVELIPL